MAVPHVGDTQTLSRVRALIEPAEDAKRNKSTERCGRAMEGSASASAAVFSSVSFPGPAHRLRSVRCTPRFADIKHRSQISLPSGPCRATCSFPTYSAHCVALACMPGTPLCLGPLADAHQPPTTTHKLLRCGHVFDSVGDQLRKDIDILISGEIIQKVRKAVLISPVCVTVPSCVYRASLARAPYSLTGSRSVRVAAWRTRLALR